MPERSDPEPDRATLEPSPPAGPLTTTWRRALASVGGNDPGDRVLAGVCDAYREPHRRYHDQRHLRAVVAAVADLTGAATPGAVSAHLVLAAFYHDVVYDPRRADNEAVSAARARDELVVCGVPPVDAERVAEAVAATAHLGETAGAPPAVGPLLDADLAVLGSGADRYRRYAAEVRAEYAHVADDGWRTGRAAVLRHLQGQRLFVTPSGRAMYDAAARDNLRWELGELTAGRIPGWAPVTPDRRGVSPCGDRPPAGAS